MQHEARATAETVARASYGRLVALLAARTRDLAAAEDALADAFRAALESWPARGVPDNPEAWLLTAARRTLGHAARHQGVRAAAAPALVTLVEELASRESEAIPDERLRLLFVCAHPAIDEASRAPLMLQTVLGLDAARIAGPFLVSPAAMGQRLSRAKARIRDAGIAFAVPEPAELPARLDPVLDAIYAAYGSGWDAIDGSDPRRRGLVEEALWLARLTAALLPHEPEALGLASLLLHCEARRPARRDATGRFVPLAEQDVSRWQRPMIIEAETLLRRAGTLNRLGRFQLEAAIQSLHAVSAVAGQRPAGALAALYAGLVAVAPSLGALVGQAAAVAEVSGAAAALAMLDALDGADLYQPAWALRAHLLGQLGSPAARAAHDRAIGLTEDAAVRAWLTARRDTT